MSGLPDMQHSAEGLTARRTLMEELFLMAQYEKFTAAWKRLNSKTDVSKDSDTHANPQIREQNQICLKERADFIGCLFRVARKRDL